MQAVIEVPAGNNHQLRYARSTKEFVSDKEAGQDKVIGFLPFPGNYGFIPSTEVDSKGRGLEILVLSERQETGAVLEVIPVAVLQLETAGELQPIVVAVPARPSQRTIDAVDYSSFSREYPVVKDMLKLWFLHRRPNAQTKFVAWRDEKFADREIQRWMKL